jgi:GNAT-family acetyltransferase (TIGR03103 family)
MLKKTAEHRTAGARPRQAAHRNRLGHRLQRIRQQGWQKPVLGKPHGVGGTIRNAALDCGWGRLLFAQTFHSPVELVEALGAEGPQRRDIAFYVREPQVLLAHAPQDVFLDPSHTYRLDLATYRPHHRQAHGFLIRRLASQADAAAINRIYATRAMVQVDPSFFWEERDNRALSYWIAEDEASGEVIGTVTGIDHHRAFDDPEGGTSLWCLAVDPQARFPGIGEELLRRLADHFKARGAPYMDLSVLYDNEQAIALYEKLGFVRVPFFSVKRKNSINERFFATPQPGEYEALNPYARIIVDAARRRGIGVEVTDGSGGFFRLSHGGRSIHCRESLSELTSGVAVSICDDKAVTTRLVRKAGVEVPEQIDASSPIAEIEAFLARHGSVVVKPARGEQGRGIAVGLTDTGQIEPAIENARAVSDRVLLESCFTGEDLRLVIIDYKLAAAAVRRPPSVIGDGKHDLRTLIERQSRRREAATQGESRIPIDSETERCLSAAGLALDSVLEPGREVVVRKTANLHTGGSIHDVTDIVHPRLVEAACTVARAIEIPVVGVDFMIKAPGEPEYVFIEANERPGLANHEPQPVAERFVDLLFPQSLPPGLRHELGVAAG